ncbi:helix-turn-helix domain-containing protein [uncultured Megamonas sp.]|uniref:helix-turn-helix domain-containing protein n=1 Tax=uncultured Megamonas sp. TaxID=286140 RepID=UPI00259BD443|nr:helix-turn-helix domain-containing protein [uncultured Megamonas sp.]
MSYHHLTISERIRIEVLSILGYSTRFIAKFLHRHHSTIARELSRNKIKNEYVSISAHNNYLKRRKNSSHSSKYNEFLSNLISEKLHENWSPEQISNALLNGKLSFKTIYNWIYISKLKGISFKNLRHKGKRRKKNWDNPFYLFLKEILHLG